MSDLTVNYDGLIEGANSIGSLSDGLAQDLHDLDLRSTQLTSQWEGDSQETYLSQYLGWAADMQELVDVVDAVGAAVEEAAQIYRNADDQVGRLWAL